MSCKIYPLRTLQTYRYVVVFSYYRGKLMLSRHQQRTTWETQGGHIEPGETPEAAAARELFEESGALRCQLTPVCDYRCGDERCFANGMVFVAKIEVLGSLPESEMAEVALFEELPDNLTYPDITPVLYQEVCRANWL